MRIFFFIFFLFLFSAAFSQNDTVKSVTGSHYAKPDTVISRKHPPGAAMLMSMCLPGLGQAYNKKYWKIPLVYASMGTTIYFFNFNNKLYRHYKQAYINKTDTASSTIDEYLNYNKDQLYELQSYHQKYRDLNVILTALFYTINVVDAYVDAHLMNFDVSDDLSLHIMPSMNISTANRKPSAGITLAFTF